MQVGLGRAHQGAGKLLGGPEALTSHLPTELNDSEAIRPQAALLEKHFLEGEKQPSTGQGPFFYIGGTNGASM